MTQPKPKIRLFVPQPYTANQELSLDEKPSHYLAHVMRQKVGDAVAVFNGQDGEWLAEISVIQKKKVTLRLKQALVKQRAAPDMWLAFAPLKNKTELMVEKAVELGVSRLVIVFTQHSVVKSVNMEKLQAHAVEAAEQCERHDIPAIDTCKDMRFLLGDWPKERTLLYGDESGGGMPLKQLLPSLPQGKYGVLIGPEGGFSAEEHQLLKIQKAQAFTMGPRILRADTAAVAALACVQAWLGDWEAKPSFEASHG